MMMKSIQFIISSIHRHNHQFFSEEGVGDMVRPSIIYTGMMNAILNILPILKIFVTY